jgi:hypothetical protein
MGGHFLLVHIDPHEVASVSHRYINTLDST